MKLRVTVAAAVLALVLAALCLVASAVKAEEISKPDEKPAPHYTRIGVYQFGNETSNPNAGKDFSKILFARLSAKFKDVQFVYITPEDSTYPEGPVLLRHAQRLGEKYGVDAIIDGSFLAFQITGGSWPSRATQSPEVLLQASVRVVNTADGTVFHNYSHMPTRPKIFSTRIRTESELWSAVTRDAIDDIAANMDKDGVFFKKEKGK
jgi:hypothetical protein